MLLCTTHSVRHFSSFWPSLFSQSILSLSFLPLSHPERKGKFPAFNRILQYLSPVDISEELFDNGSLPRSSPHDGVVLVVEKESDWHHAKIVLHLNSNSERCGRELPIFHSWVNICSTPMGAHPSALWCTPSPSTPNIRGIDGPHRSISRTATWSDNFVVSKINNDSDWRWNNLLKKSSHLYFGIARESECETGRHWTLSHSALSRHHQDLNSLS